MFEVFAYKTVFMVLSRIPLSNAWHDSEQYMNRLKTYTRNRSGSYWR
jgi:hypothetical protein